MTEQKRKLWATLDHRPDLVTPSELRQLEYDWRQAEKEAVQAAKIVICTCYTAASAKLAEKRFDIIVIDEACQIGEPSTLIPITLYEKVLRLWLVGDPHQNPPPVFIKRSIVPQLKTPLMVRLIEIGFASVTLDEQYRLRPKLLEFPNARFYDGALKSGYRDQDGIGKLFDDYWKLFRENWKTDGLIALYSEDCEAMCDAEGRWTNPGHVELVITRLRMMANSRFSHLLKHLVILTFYRGQKDLYAARIAEESRKYPVFASIICSTVDAFQGREGGAGVLDCVRTRKGHLLKMQGKIRMGFADDENRFNVALTRFCHGMMFIADRGLMANMAEDSKAFREYGQYLENEHVIRSLSVTTQFTKAQVDGHKARVAKREARSAEQAIKRQKREEDLEEGELVDSD